MTLGSRKDAPSRPALQSPSVRQQPLAAAATKPSERRRAGRRPSDLPGYIHWGNRLDSLIRCKVRDMSATGALLQLDPQRRKISMDMLAERFTLVVFQMREETHIECQLMRRSGSTSEVGVRFVGQFRTVTRTKLTTILTGKRN